jgi:hypothetical protein
MAIRDLFSKRAAKAARAGTPDVYQYDELPQAFRVQVVHIWQRAIGDYRPEPRMMAYAGPPPSLWEKIERTVAEEHGLFQLGERREDPMAQCVNYFLRQKDTGRALDVIEAVFLAIDEDIRPDYHYRGGPLGLQSPDRAIDDLNQRFREHAIGYEYANGQIVRVDSEYVHAEAVKPALALLQEPGFLGPQDEFMRAHQHYREGKYKEAINEALKAFESTMKCICDERGWAYDKTKSTAKTLLDLLFTQGLVPAFLQTGFSGLRAVLEGVVPTARNRTSGHGQGSQPKDVPRYLAAYILHATASNIVFLVEAHKTTP